jgi:hypothetical protein
MKHTFKVTLELLDKEVVLFESTVITIDDEKPYSRPDNVVANLVKSWVKSMLGIPTRPEEGGPPALKPKQ